MEDKPEAGTKEDLLSDALSLGLSLDERALREWHRLGLVASPKHRPRQTGSGTQPGLYTPPQRALFRAVARNKAEGAKNSDLATIPVYAWMNFPTGWIELSQAHRAMDTLFLAREKAPPPTAPRKRVPRHFSLREAEIQMKRLLDQVDVNGARIGRSEFRRVITQQLYSGRIEQAEVFRVTEKLFDPAGIAIVRGPAGAPMTAETLTEYIVGTMRGLRQYPTLTDDDIRILRNRHQVLRPEYERVRPIWEAQATPDLKPMFRLQDPSDQVIGIASTVLIMIGLGVHRTHQPQGTA